MPHALLVDDNTDTLEALTEVLRAEGFTASAAPNLDEAKAALARQTPDVVLLDLNLPDGSGMTLLDGIEGLRAPAVVLITGHASVSTVVEALACEAVVTVGALAANAGCAATTLPPATAVIIARMIISPRRMT